MSIRELLYIIISAIKSIFEASQVEPGYETKPEIEKTSDNSSSQSPVTPIETETEKPTTSKITLRPIWFVSDNIYVNNNNLNADKDNVQNFIDALTDLGADCRVYGYGPNKNLEALDSDTVPDNALVVEIAGGADAASIWEKAGTWYQNLKGNRKNIIVFMDTSLRITGLDWLPRAHDDNYSPSWFTGLEHPDQYLINNGFDFIEGVSREDISAAVQFIYKHSVLDSSGATEQCQNVDVSTERIQVPLLQFQNMITRFNIFLNREGNEPKNVFLDPGTCGKYVSNSVYHNMFSRFMDWYNTYNGEYPNYVWTVNDIAPQIQPSTVDDLSKFEQMFGVRPNTVEELYDWAGDHLIWIDYNNDGMSNSSIEDQISKNGVAKCNCTDQSQFLRPILISMGNEVRFCNGNVKCSDGNWYGHVWLEYRKIGETNWKTFDAVAITTPGLSRTLGNLCCIYGTSNVSHDDDWLFERDQHI